jgi:hypothetical protein
MKRALFWVFTGLCGSLRKPLLPFSLEWWWLPMVIEDGLVTTVVQLTGEIVLMRALLPCRVLATAAVAVMIGVSQLVWMVETVVGIIVLLVLSVVELVSVVVVLVQVAEIIVELVLLESELELIVDASSTPVELLTVLSVEGVEVVTVASGVVAATSVYVDVFVFAESVVVSVAVAESFDAVTATAGPV